MIESAKEYRPRWMVEIAGEEVQVDSRLWAALRQFFIADQAAINNRNANTITMYMNAIRILHAELDGNLTERLSG